MQSITIMLSIKYRKIQTPCCRSNTSVRWTTVWERWYPVSEEKGTADCISAGKTHTSKPREEPNVLRFCSSRTLCRSRGIWRANSLEEAAIVISPGNFRVSSEATPGAANLLRNSHSSTAAALCRWTLQQQSTAWSSGYESSQMSCANEKNGFWLGLRRANRAFTSISYVQPVHRMNLLFVQ